MYHAVATAKIQASITYHNQLSYKYVHAGECMDEVEFQFLQFFIVFTSSHIESGVPPLLKSLCFLKFVEVCFSR